VQLRVTLGEEDLVALAEEQERFRRRVSPAARIAERQELVLWLLFFGGLMLAVAITLALLPPGGVLVPTVTITVSALVLWLVLFVLVRRHLAASARRGIIQDELARVGPLSYEWEAEGDTFVVSDQHGPLRYHWDEVRTVIEAGERLFVLLPFARSLVLPLRLLSAEQRAQVLAIIQAQRWRFPENDPADLGTR
jgi:small-conductance mechanosensitive channel